MIFRNKKSSGMIFRDRKKFRHDIQEQKEVPA
jgi:hypothetical protein